MRALRSFPSTGAAILVALAFALVGCESDDVTGPVQTVVPPPTGQGGASATWNITVTPSTNSVDLNAGAATVQIEVRARRADNNQLVAPGTTALLTTTAGQLTAGAGTAASIPIEFDVAGVARATLTLAGDDLAGEGVVIVRAQIENSFGSAQINLVNVPVELFQVLTVSPSTGPPSGGTPLTITGSGFRPGATGTVDVLGSTLQLLDVNVASSSRITARTPSVNLPSGQNGLASITITNGPDPQTGAPGGTDTVAGAFTYTRSSNGATTVKLISASPTFGPNEGGTQVSIIGEGFGSSVQVFFTNGPLVEAQVLSITPTRIEAVTPSATGPNAGNANAIVDIRVVDPVSGQSDTLAGAFQYGRGGGGDGLFISALSPTEDEYLGGTLVTLFGQGFEEPVAVSLAGVGQQIISVTGTEVVVRTVPVQIACADLSGPVTITNIETNTGATGPVFTYIPIEPVLLSVTPNSGGENGGTQVTIQGFPRERGVGFDPPVEVTIDGVPATNVQFIDGDTIRATVPEFTGTFQSESCATGSGTGTRLVSTSVDVGVTNLPTGCTDTLEGGFTYTPANGDCVVPVDAAFSFNGESGSLMVNFIDQSSGNITTYAWDFGDGTTSTMENPSHTYALPGTYTVTLTVFDGTTSDTATQDVTVPLP